VETIISVVVGALIAAVSGGLVARAQRERTTLNADRK
jgi:hypothetical protein